MPFVLNDPTQTSPEVHVADEGVQFIITVYDQDSEIVDLSSATSLLMNFKNPSKETFSETATLYTDGTDGKMTYTFLEGDIDEIGMWSYQGVVEFSDGLYHTNIEKFRVYPNIEIPDPVVP
jgi:hypothetical protein